MFNPTQIVIEAFINELRLMYERTYSTLEPSYPGIISFAAQLALQTIATSDATYHDVNHTIMVTLVGQEILRGRSAALESQMIHKIQELIGQTLRDSPPHDARALRPVTPRLAPPL